MQAYRHDTKDLAGKIKFVGSKITIKKSKYIQLKKNPELAKKIINNYLYNKKGKKKLKKLENDNYIPSLNKIMISNGANRLLSPASEEKSTKDTSPNSYIIKPNTSNKDNNNLNKLSIINGKSRSILMRAPYLEALNQMYISNKCSGIEVSNESQNYSKFYEEKEGIFLNDSREIMNVSDEKDLNNFLNDSSINSDIELDQYKKMIQKDNINDNSYDNDLRNSIKTLKVHKIKNLKINGMVKDIEKSTSKYNRNSNIVNKKDFNIFEKVIERQLMKDKKLH